MGLSNWTPKITALVFIGCGITVLFIKSVVAAWEHSFRPAVWYLVVGALLAVIFFRNRKFAFATIVLSFLLVTVGMTAIFHPTPAGLLITLGSAACAYALVVWHAKKYPHLTRKDWKIFFDGDPKLPSVTGVNGPDVDQAADAGTAKK